MTEKEIRTLAGRYGEWLNGEVIEMTDENLINFVSAVNQTEKQDADDWYEKALWGEKQKPVAWWNGRRTAWFDFEVDRPLDECKIPLYTAPPQREWVGLTDEEIIYEWELWRASIPRYVGFAKGIEAKLKGKNHG